MTMIMRRMSSKRRRKRKIPKKLKSLKTNKQIQRPLSKIPNPRGNM
jgi:hypothetical protein